MVVSHSPQTLDAAITKAKEIETGFTFAQPMQQQQVMVNQMEVLQQQVAQLTANLANTQIQSNPKPRWNQQNQRNTNFQTQRPMECWRCGEKGHFARECQSEIPVKAQLRF